MKENRNEELEKRNVQNPVDDKVEEINDKIVQLEDEDGVDRLFEFIDLIKYNSDEYFIGTPVDTGDSSEDESQVIILKLEINEETGEETYIGFDDEELLDAVYSLFKEKWKDKYTFTDEDDE